MSDQPNFSERSMADRIDIVCDQFEKALIEGEQPRIEDFLGETIEPERVALLEELLLLELGYLKQNGETPKIADYSTWFPDDTEVVSKIFAQLEMAETILFQDPQAETSGGGAQPSIPQSPNEEDALPKSIGPFRVVSQLGEGAFGAVYLGHDPQIDRPVAIKVLHADEYSDPTAILTEARAQGAVDHPHVVPIYHVGELDSGTLYIVSKFLQGGSLHDRIRSGEPISCTQAVQWCIQIAEALDVAHRAGLTHRDLKPANILLDESRRAYVSDFGLALHEGEQSQHRGEVSGSPAYMAPEQVRGRSHHLDGRTDIWALGVVLYELLSKHRPFSGKTRRDLFEEIEQREPRPLRIKNQQVPRELEEVVQHCLRKNVADRYATAEDVAEELRTWLQNQYAETATAIVPEPTPAPKPQGQRPKVAGFLIAVLVVVVGVWWIVSGNTNDDVPVVDSPPETSGRKIAGSTPTPPVKSNAISATIDIRVWGDGKNGITLDDPQALPLRNGDQVRFDIELKEPAHVYVVWIDAEGEPMEVFPHDPERGQLGDEPRTLVRSPATRNQGWQVNGRSGMETAVVLIRRNPYPQANDLAKSLTMSSLHTFNTSQELVTYVAGLDTDEPEISAAHHRGLNKESSKIDDPVLDLLVRLQDDFDAIHVVRAAHVGEER